jgi:hypothetical protein
MKLFCQHNYEIIKEHNMESPAEKMKSFKSASGLPLEFFKSKYIIIYQCKKCSKIKESVFEN